MYNANSMLAPAEKIMSEIIVAPSLVACGVGAALAATGLIGLANKLQPLPPFMHKNTGIELLDSLQNISPTELLLGGLAIAFAGLLVLKGESVMRDMVIKGRAARVPTQQEARKKD